MNKEKSALNKVVLRRRKIPEGWKSYPCKECNKTYSSLFWLKKHLLQHTKNNPTIDDKVGLKKRTRSSSGKKLKKHSMTNTKVTVKNSKANVRLKETDLKTVKYHFCDKCPKSFTVLSNLKRHLRVIHSKKESCEDDAPSESVTNQKQIEGHTSDETLPRSVDIAIVPMTDTEETAGNSKSNEATSKKRSQFACDECGGSFSKRSSLKRHFQIHSKVVCQSEEERRSDDDPCEKASIQIPKKTKRGKQYTCNTCDKIFTRSWDLAKHLLTHTEAKPHQCEVCNKSFKQISHLRTHSLSHTREKQYECYVCDMTFTLKGNLKRHEQLHASVSYKCRLCTESFSFKSELTRHHFQHKKEFNFECKVCKKKFTLKEYLRRHTVKNHLTKDSCDICMKGLSQCSFHKKSMKVRNQECDQCDKKFCNKSQLERHQATHSVDKPHQCSTCQKSFRTEELLSRHCRIHADDKPHPCDLCDKSFVDKWVLRRHKIGHNRDKSYECKTCFKAFNTKDTLRVHQIQHSQERTFQCGICLKPFFTKYGVQRHNLIHTGEKSHACDICGLKFAQRCHMTSHVATHQDERPFDCVFCGRAFKRMYNLREHYPLHTLQRPFACNVCRVEFSWRSQLRKHQIVHNPEEPPDF